MFCTNCGTQLADEMKFCPNCGTAIPAAEMPEAEAQPAEAEAETAETATAEQNPAPVEPQLQPKKKGGKTALLMIAALAIFAVIGMMMLFGGSPADNGSDTEGIYAIVDELDVLLAGSFEDYSIEYDEAVNCILIGTWSDGIAEATQYVNSNSNLKESWNTLSANMCTMSKTAQDYVDASGYEDVLVTVSLLNDTNLENVLLMCVDGIVFYDCTQE